MDSCPHQKTIVLYRSGLGAGLRKILNYNEVEKAFQENWIRDYTSFTVSQDTSMKDELDLIISIGLIISIHLS